MASSVAQNNVDRSGKYCTCLRSILCPNQRIMMSLERLPALAPSIYPAFPTLLLQTPKLTQLSQHQASSHKSITMQSIIRRTARTTTLEPLFFRNSAAATSSRLQRGYASAPETYGTPNGGPQSREGRSGSQGAKLVSVLHYHPSHSCSGHHGIPILEEIV